jgi:hypothetical protein
MGTGVDIRSEPYSIGIISDCMSSELTLSAVSVLKDYSLGRSFSSFPIILAFIEPTKDMRLVLPLCKARPVH